MKPGTGPEWEAALDTIHQLRAHGHVALLAGGCVRDMLLDRTPKDYDVATDATPDRLREIFPRVRMVGAKFGVVLIRRHGQDIEVATFRTDGVYSDGRHPDEIRFGSDIDDARRRDFTINGLFFDPIQEHVIDHVGGRSDLDARILRTIGEPADRFAEDHLRMLRAVRFSARLDFSIEEQTWTSIVQLADRLPLISAERIFMELELILTAPSRARGWSLLMETRLARFLAPSWRIEEESARRVGRRMAALSESWISTPLALSSALVDESQGEQRSICRELRLSNQNANAVEWLTSTLPLVAEPDAMELADLKTYMASAYWADLLDLIRADRVAGDRDLRPYEQLMRRSATIEADAISPQPFVSGDDLLEMGWTPGPKFGETLSAIYRAQLNETLGTRSQAIALARKMMAGGAV